MEKPPDISVIIPAHNSEKFIAHCLEALNKSTFGSFETIVVDDASLDDTASIARDMGASVLELKQQAGPGVARNHGSEHAAGEILMFIDSDVLVKPDTLAKVYAAMSGNADIAAVFGSYDDTPAEADFLSQYRNLLHHYVHQNSDPEASTFWAGCGAIRRDVLRKMGGFSSHPIEDIELGFRMREKGHSILLDRDIQVTHLKRWGWKSMIMTDIFVRAIPWSKLIFSYDSFKTDLNLSISSRISTALVGLLSIVLVLLGLDLVGFGVITANYTITALVLTVTWLVIMNRGLYGFFLEKRGLVFTLRAIPVHFLYYFYCGVSFLASWLGYKSNI